MYLIDRIQKFFDSKELEAKMSSVLNVSNSSGSKPEEFSIDDIEVLVDKKEQNWFKRAHVRKFLGLVHIHSSTAKLADNDQKTRASLRVEGDIHSMDPLRGDAQDHDIFLSETGALYVLNKCRKPTNKLNTIADILGVKIRKNKWLFIEQESPQNFMDVFKGEEMLTQFNVDGYRIDPYFPRHKLAVECDESGHKDRDIEYKVR